MSAANGLRLWKRQRARALELGAFLPDLMLQVKALDQVVSKLPQQHPQAFFRVSAFRMETRIDERKSTESLLQFHELLQAEMDALVHSAPDPAGGEKPATKALQKTVSQDKAGKSGVVSNDDLASMDKAKQCRFWGTTDGCRNGKQCKYLHPDLPDKKDRCWICSATTHQKNECPVATCSASSNWGEWWWRTWRKSWLQR